MKNLVIAVIALVFGGQVMAADLNKFTDIKVSAEASYVGGQEALQEFLANELRDVGLYERGSALLELQINEEGEITKVKLLKSIGADADRYIIRAVEKMPKWNPALQNGRAVTFRYQLPVVVK